MRFVALLAVLVASGLAWGVACGSSGPDATPGDAGADATVGRPDGGTDAAADAAPPRPYPLTQTCPPSDHPDECPRCNRDRCCESREAILATDAGNELVDCMIEAGTCASTEPCYTGCFAQQPGQVDLYLAQFACLAHNCPSCATADPCAACMRERCEPEGTACDLSRECFLLQSCGAACPSGSQPCIEACLTKYEPARALQSALVVCAMNRCSDVCGGG